MRVAALLLAAGRSARFGAEDKLSAPFRGVPLGLHAARALAQLRLPLQFVVASGVKLEWPGFEIVPNATPDAGIGHSIALGTAAARSAGASAVLIALADMPLVTTAHLHDVLARYAGAASLVATGNGGRAMPPALFGADWFEALERLSEDRGAHALLDTAIIVDCPAAQLVDVDTPDDLVMVRDTPPT